MATTSYTTLNSEQYDGHGLVVLVEDHDVQAGGAVRPGAWYYTLCSCSRQAWLGTDQTIEAARARLAAHLADAAAAEALIRANTSSSEEFARRMAEGREAREDRTGQAIRDYQFLDEWDR